MKATGIVRRVDHLGRIVIPIKLRRLMAIGYRDAVEIFVDDGNRIVLRKYQPACIFCGDCDGLQVYMDQRVCGACRHQLGLPALPAVALAGHPPGPA